MPSKSQLQIDGAVSAQRIMNATRSRLLRLPAEIRSKIYVFTLATEATLELKHSTIKAHTTLLRVCHQLRIEAKPLFYSTNRFLLADIYSPFLQRFLAAAGRSMLRRIPLLEVHFHAPEACYHDLLHDWTIYQEERYSTHKAERVAFKRLFTRLWAFQDQVVDVATTLKSYGLREIYLKHRPEDYESGKKIMVERTMHNYFRHHVDCVTLVDGRVITEALPRMVHDRSCCGSIETVMGHKQNEVCAGDCFLPDVFRLFRLPHG